MVFDVRRRSSLLGLLTAAALLLGQLAGVVHMAAVQHQRCLEHGELVHATLRAHRPDGVGAGTTAMAAGDDEADRHEHCLAAGCGRQGPLAAPSATARTTEPACLPPAPADRALALAAPPLGFAPKTSPPARG